MPASTNGSSIDATGASGCVSNTPAAPQTTPVTALVKVSTVGARRPASAASDRSRAHAVTRVAWATSMASSQPSSAGPEAVAASTAAVRIATTMLISASKGCRSRKSRSRRRAVLVGAVSVVTAGSVTKRPEISRRRMSAAPEGPASSSLDRGTGISALVSSENDAGAVRRYPRLHRGGEGVGRLDAAQGLRFAAEVVVVSERVNGTRRTWSGPSPSRAVPT